MTDERENGNMNQEEKAPLDLQLVNTVLPEDIAIMPIYPKPIFPEINLPISFVGEKHVTQIDIINEKYDGIMGLVLPKEHDENKQPVSFYEVGCVVRILKILKVTPGHSEVLVESIKRFTRRSEVGNDDLLRWRVSYYDEPSIGNDQELRGYLMAISSEVKELVNYNSIFQEQLKMLLTQFSFEHPGRMIDTIAYILAPEAEKLQSILETFDIKKRADILLRLLKEDIEVAKLQDKINKNIQETASKQQKEYFLREQLKAIKKELGIEKEDKESDVEKIEQKLEKLKLNEDAKKVVDSELDKLKMINVESPEYAVSRNYLELITDLPWGVYSEDNTDLKEARGILDRDHYGLKDVKNTILEFLNTIIRKGTVSGSILCLVGPPGVGKTSIGKSIANALHRKFFRFSLGGMRDEAEIKGHRKTYIGAMPGKIIQSLKRVGTANPVIMLDEIDKVGASYQGDPASALLEVLDPEQNSDFLDHYLDVPFDLSKILFITTANQLDTIPQPLLDRMEVIRLSGYVKEEKLEIAEHYLIPHQYKENGIAESELKIPKDVLDQIIDKYAREAGVRNLEKQIRKLMRKASLKITEEGLSKIDVNVGNLEEFLGKPVFHTEKLYNTNQVGVVLGLAYTSYGGSTLYIEASGIKSSSAGFKQTGQLGDVMKESTELAYSYVRSLITKQNADNHYFDEHFVHVHIPEGATPKDGPSAGITLALALYSLAIETPVRNDVAMTGELTLTGKVLPIGGLKEKILAAKRVNIKELIVPKENEKDFIELDEFIKEDVKIHFVDHFEEVLKIALEGHF
ncbi:endopeptidase La [Aureibacter tunicatorum]|uniref:Lon protease n=1 Tax=Aureibacter tunicatorum TaxID=866807 RepID=A0AAE3XKC3_9BACT|nr:endopeptidase La [Aureibacter tunicatorum]MDR6238218.1 ATP-dependent Lon protease [Aureibacter tunicatorum]BDD03251.1 Lon protease [Aureibacter tunicatorum]